MSQKSKPVESLVILSLVLIVLATFVLREAVNPGVTSQIPIVIDGYTGMSVRHHHCEYACCQGIGAPMPKGARCQRFSYDQRSLATK